MGLQKNNKWIIALSIFILIILPLLISLLYLFPPGEKFDLVREKTDKNDTIVRISLDRTLEPSYRNAIRGLLQVPFKLEWYEVCFVNNGTKFIYGNNLYEDSDVRVTLNFNKNQSIFEIPPNSAECIPHKFDKYFTYRWAFNYSINTSKVLDIEPRRIPINEEMYYDLRTTKLDQEVYTYARPETKNLIVETVLVLFSWWALLWLITRIVKLIIYGWNC